MLKVQDLNVIIKYFASQIQKRIEEIQGKSRQLKTKTNINESHSESYAENNQQAKYKNYVPDNPTEYEYIKKMSQRVQQIFGFYKWGCKNQSILNHAERQLSSKLNILTNQSQIDITKIMNYIVQISQKGFSHSNKKLFQGQKNYTNNNNNAFNKTQRKIFSKSQAKQIKQNTQTLHMMSYQATIKQQNHQPRKRTASVMCYSHSSIHPTVQIIDKLYSCMNIDKIHLSRCIQRQNYLMKNPSRRNKSALKKFQAISSCQNKDKEQNLLTRRMKTQSYYFQSKSVLREIKINSKLFGISSIQDVTDHIKKAPALNLGVFGKKFSKVKVKCATRKKKQQKRGNNQNNVE